MLRANDFMVDLLLCCIRFLYDVEVFNLYEHFWSDGKLLNHAQFNIIVA